VRAGRKLHPAFEAADRGRQPPPAFQQDDDVVIAVGKIGLQLGGTVEMRKICTRAELI
jgi:hypothetical protein